MALSKRKVILTEVKMFILIEKIPFYFSYTYIIPRKNKNPQDECKTIRPENATHPGSLDLFYEEIPLIFLRFSL